MTERKIERIYFYVIDGKGRLYHDGTLQDDIAFLDFFFKRLKPNDTGLYSEYPFVSPCGREMNFIQSAGTPYVFRMLDIGQNALIYGGTLSQPWQPGHLLYGSDDQLYHPAPHGVGRISPELLLEWQKYLDFNDQWQVQPEGPFQSLNKPSVLAPLDAETDSEATLPGPSVENTDAGPR